MSATRCAVGARAAGPGPRTPARRRGSGSPVSRSWVAWCTRRASERAWARTARKRRVIAAAVSDSTITVIAMRSPIGASTRVTVMRPGTASATATTTSRPMVGVVSGRRAPASVISRIDGWSTVDDEEQAAEAVRAGRRGSWGRRPRGSRRTCRRCRRRAPTASTPSRRLLATTRRDAARERDARGERDEKHRERRVDRRGSGAPTAASAASCVGLSRNSQPRAMAARAETAASSSVSISLSRPRWRACTMPKNPAAARK